MDGAIISKEQNDTNAIKIVGISPFLWTMGEKKGIPSLYIIQKHFAEANHEVHLLVSSENPFIPNGKNEVKDGLYEGIHIHTFNPHLKISNILANVQNKMKRDSLFYKILGGVKLWGSLFLFFVYGSKAAKRLINDVMPDVIYGHTYFGQFVASFRATGKLQNVYRAYGIRYEYINNPSLSMLMINPDLLSLTLPVDMVIITDDGSFGDKTALSIGVPEEKIRFWMNGVKKELDQNNYDVEALKRKYNLPKDKLIILTVSRLDLWKKLDRIICAMPEISKEVQDAICVIVGDGPYREELENKSKELGVENHVKFMGSVSHNNIDEFMAIADVFVSLYDYSNVGNPLLEAMVAGKCILTLDVGNTKSIIQDGINGRLISKEELPNLADITIELLNKPELRSKLGKGAKEYSQKKFITWEERAEMELKTIECLVSEKGGIN